MQYKIKPFWAGYELLDSTVDLEKDAVATIVSLLEEAFFRGMTYSFHSTTVTINVLCVDVYADGKLVEQIDLKK